MIKIALLILCTLPNLLLAQSGIQNISLKHPDSALLYVGVENIIKISGAENQNNVELKSSEGELIVKENGQFSLRVNSVNKPDTLTVFQQGKIILSKIYQVKMLSDPRLQLGTIQSNYVSVAEIEKNKSLTIVLPNWDYIAAFKVINFRLTIQNHFGKIVSNDEINMGNTLSKNQLKIIKQLAMGSKLIFENIKVIGPDKVERLFASITITIK